MIILKGICDSHCQCGVLLRFNTEELHTAGGTALHVCCAWSSYSWVSMQPVWKTGTPSLFQPVCFATIQPKGWFPYDRRRSQKIADDRGSQIADRRRSQRQLFPYNRGRSRTIAEPTFASISVSGSVKFTGALRWRENRIKTTWQTLRRKFCCKQIYFFF